MIDQNSSQIGLGSGCNPDTRRKRPAEIVLWIVFAAMGALVLATSLFGCVESKQPVGPVSDAPVIDGKVTAEVSYAAGLGLGRRLREYLDENKWQAEDAQVVRGVRDGLAGNTPEYPEERMEAAMEHIELVARERLARQQMKTDPKFREFAEGNLKSSQEAMQRLSTMDGVETLPGGLLRRVVNNGTGRFVANAKQITVNFRLELAEGTLITASKPGKPVVADVSRLPKALADVLAEMRVGDTWRIAVPPDKAYGVAGYPPIIGANQAVVVQIELLGAAD